MLKLQGTFLFLLMLGSTLVLWSCQKSKAPAVIVIAVDDFSVDDVVCNQDQLESERSGWLVLCQQSVRFTHAYTTSTQTVPAIASLLTGMYPFQHGLRTNSNQSLKVEIKTIAEEAIEHKWRTSFFSGGSPVFRKTGLHQGFEYFDDTWSVSPTEIYKPLYKNVSDFKEWLKDESDDIPFLSFFYVPDLAYLKAPTKNDFGEARNLSIESQMDELDETLYDLFKFLENQKRWKDTTVVVVGLSGRTDLDRTAVVKGENLHGENTQVALFIKPRQNSEISKQWKVDFEVSLADVGKTIQELVTENVAPSLSGTWSIYSLKRTIENEKNDSMEERPLLIESFWDSWVSGTTYNRAAVVSNHLLYVFEGTEKVFNLLMDRSEASALKANEFSTEKQSQIRDELLNIGFQFDVTQKDKETNSDWRQKVLQIPASLWLDPAESAKLMAALNNLHKKDPNNLKLTSLAVHMALKNEDWKSLLSLAQELKVELLIQVARNQFEKTNISAANKCFELASQKENSRAQIKTCEDPLFSKFLLDRSKTDPLKDFERLFEISILREAIRRHDLALQIRFDPQNLESTWPSLFETYLALPENQKLRGQLFRKTQRRGSEEF